MESEVHTGSRPEIQLYEVPQSILSGFKERDDQHYWLQSHLDYIESNQVDIPVDFVKNISDPLFNEFSEGNPSYEKINDEEWIEDDLRIIKDLKEFITNHYQNIEYPADIDSRMSVINDRLSNEREERSAKYIFEICRRLDDTEDYSGLEGVALTGFQDYWDMVEVSEKIGIEPKEHLDDPETVISYSGINLFFNDFEKGYNFFQHLKERFKDREEFNKLESPKIIFK